MQIFWNNIRNRCRRIFHHEGINLKILLTYELINSRIDLPHTVSYLRHSKQFTTQMAELSKELNDGSTSRYDSSENIEFRIVNFRFYSRSIRKKLDLLRTTIVLTNEARRLSTQDTNAIIAGSVELHKEMAKLDETEL